MGAFVGDRPLIGVTTSEVRLAEKVEQTAQGEPPHREMALGLKYLEAIEAAGGLPVVLPPLALDAVEPLLDRLCGLCLSGGPDLDPGSYGSPPHPRLGPTEPDLDHFELALARRADRAGMPILAVCRGQQALNVARGGTLYQDLPDEVPSGIVHRQTTPGDQVSHSVRIAPGSVLADVLGTVEAEVNSFHHQAVKRLGARLRAVAWAEDGVVEAIEARDRPFVVGVQWHAEGIVDRPEQAALFRAFVDAAAELRTALPQARAA